MADSTQSTSESLFRPSKRRKVFRKRATEEDAADNVLPATAERSRSPGQQHEDSSELPSVVRRPAAKKHGINFSNGGAPGQAKDQPDMQMALVPVVRRDEAEVVQTDRFMKPTGKVVVEDRHLTAYVDSKLAELRSSTSTPIMKDGTPMTDILQNASQLSPASISQMPMSTGLATLHSTSNSQTWSQPHTDRPRQKQRRGRQPHIDPSATARDAMVDRIMQESQVPMYDRPSAAATNIDSDEAAAEAFKAEFLAGLEEQNRRKPLAPPPTARGAQNAAQSSGPKLGGSRQQREKMKAIEEAKGAAGRK